MERARQSFPSQTAINRWMELQMERMLRQISIPRTDEDRPLRNLAVCERIRALSNVPANTSHADYKEDIMDVRSEKY